MGFQPNYVVSQTPAGTVVELAPDQSLMGGGETANDFLSLAFEHEAVGLLAYDTSFDASFFDLKSGLAGDLFQKFVNYSRKLALVLPDLDAHDARIRELAHDHRRHPVIRFFDTKEEAYVWLQSA